MEISEYIKGKKGKKECHGGGEGKEEGKAS
jgi:hypothetical protein